MYDALIWTGVTECRISAWTAKVTFVSHLPHLSGSSIDVDEKLVV